MTENRKKDAPNDGSSYGTMAVNSGRVSPSEDRQ